MGERVGRKEKRNRVIRLTSGVVDLGRADEDITIDTREAVPDHLRCEQEADAPARVDLAVVVQLQSRQGTETLP